MPNSHDLSSVDENSNANDIEISDERVKNAILFLTHPKVQSSPIDQKISFLKKKGLLQKEIEIALNQIKDQNAYFNRNEDAGDRGTQRLVILGKTSIYF